VGGISTSVRVQVPLVHFIFKRSLRLRDMLPCLACDFQPKDAIKNGRIFGMLWDWVVIPIFFHSGY
jgi:hypothetical protein